MLYRKSLPVPKSQKEVETCLLSTQVNSVSAGDQVWECQDVNQWETTAFIS